MKVDIKSKNSEVILKGGDYSYNHFTYWAKSENYFAVRATFHILDLIDLRSKKKKKISFEDDIKHVFHCSNDLFLVFTEKGVFKFNGSATLPEKIELEKEPKFIRSGTTLGDKHLFLHVMVNNSDHEARIYDLSGNMISRINVPVSLKYVIDYFLVISFFLQNVFLQKIGFVLWEIKKFKFLKLILAMVLFLLITKILQMRATYRMLL